MRNLRNSVISLFLFFSIVLSIAQVQYIEENVLNFQAAFFIMLVLATLLGILGPSRIKVSVYSYMGAWLIAYLFVWAIYWRFLSTPRTMDELIVQFLLIEIAAALSHNVGLQINNVNTVLSEVANGAYPNRTLDFKMAADAISRELTRSRRYSRPLSIIVFQFAGPLSFSREYSAIEKDLTSHFLAAKIGKIISDYARQTDLIMIDQEHRFVILCPETDGDAAHTLAKRIYEAIEVVVQIRAAWSTASFPVDALSFDELYKKAVFELPTLADASLFTHAEKSKASS